MIAKSFAFAALAAFALSGCQTLSLLGGGSSIVRIETDPPGATVTVGQYGECTSPCTVGLDVPREMKIAKDGYETKTITVKPHSGKVSVKLDLAAASTEVDSQTLPDLPGED